MKKSLFFVATAALVLASCNNDVKIDENTVPVGSNVQKEISFSPYANTPKRAKGYAPVTNAVFPTTYDMVVAAWDVTNSRDFFGATTFTYTNPTWTGSKYWPLSAAYINFLAYSELNAGSATWNLAGENKAASGVTLVMDDNKTAQKDLMYAIGNGEVTFANNTLTFPAVVPMTFKHAQAWVRFKADAYDATSGDKVTLKSITLNGAKYNGTFTVTHTNYNAIAGQSVSGAWTALGDAQPVAVPNWTPAAIAYDAINDGVDVGDGLLIVPDDNNTTADWTSFTIAYALDGKDYTYTYTPATAVAANVDQAKMYTFKINFRLHEIAILPEVTEWVEGGPTAVPVGGESFAIGTNVTLNRPADAVTYKLNITGLTSTTAITVNTTGSATAFTSAPTATVPNANGVTVLTYSLPANDGAERSFTITVTDNGTSGSDAVSTITINQAAVPAP